MIELLLILAITVPLVLALWLAVVRDLDEGWVAHLAQGGAIVSGVSSLVAIALWLASGGAPLLTPPRALFAHESYHFNFELVLDRSSAVFLFLVQGSTGMVMRFSRFYLHREPGFRRFFATVLLFQAAMCLLTLAGNLDLMFAGWEMVGVSSFLLIAFYWERHSAVRNALKTYSVYRMADIGMLLAACLEGSGDRRGLGLLLLLAAIGKSAQFPVSFWVPRAMEGPTPSSALFYGALSVHAGAYLLLRTYPLWGEVTGVRVCVGVVGLLTAALCSTFSRVQSTIKAQIGYASVAQVGLIFVEIALGFRTLALVHVVCNAFLRCYQLLVSPSAVAYLLRRQAAAGGVRARDGRSFLARLFPERWSASLYVFALSEGYLKEGIKGLLWGPLRRLGEVVQPLRMALFTVGSTGALAVVIFAPNASERAGSVISWVFIAVALLFSGCAVGSWRRPLQAVAWVSGSSLALAAAVFALSPTHDRFAAVVYAAAIAVVCGLGLLGVARAVPEPTPLVRFAGRFERQRVAMALSLVSALGIAGVPLLPTFIGEDLLLHDTLRQSGLASFLIACVLALNGYLAVRTFAFTFLGQPATGAAGQLAARPEPPGAEEPSVGWVGS